MNAPIITARDLALDLQNAHDAIADHERAHIQPVLRISINGGEMKTVQWGLATYAILNSDKPFPPNMGKTTR